MAFPQTVRWINEILNNLSQVRLFLVPSGGVILWHGASNAVPKGWAICDGTNGTPDLRDRFVIGAGGKYGLDATGGAASATPDVTAGTAKTGIGLANASSNGTAGSQDRDQYSECFCCHHYGCGCNRHRYSRHNT